MIVIYDTRYDMIFRKNTGYMVHDSWYMEHGTQGTWYTIHGTRLSLSPRFWGSNPQEMFKSHRKLHYANSPLTISVNCRF